MTDTPGWLTSIMMLYGIPEWSYTAQGVIMLAFAGLTSVRFWTAPTCNSRVIKLAVIALIGSASLIGSALLMRSLGLPVRFWFYSAGNMLLVTHMALMVWRESTIRGLFR